MANYKLTLSYDGRAYFGWQRHGDKPTIQGALEAALTTIFGEPCFVTGAGRTDRGAHAEGQVATVLLSEQLASGAETTAPALSEALAATLPPDIRVVEVEEKDASFHARNSATGKRYRYELFFGQTCSEELIGRVWHLRRPVSVAAMRDASSVLLGKHDFASFATPTNFKGQSTVRDLRGVTVEGALPRLRLVFDADSFLYKMVRNLAAALVKVGEGRYDEAQLTQILAAKDRKASPGTAPASGLYLDRVFYDG